MDFKVLASCFGAILSTTAFATGASAASTQRISEDVLSGNANGQSFGESISSDGKFAVYASDATDIEFLDSNSATDVFVRDISDSSTERISVDSDGNDANASSSTDSCGGSISAEVGGHRYVVFSSYATDLVSSSSSDVPTYSNVFVRDLTTDTTELVSVSDAGTKANEDSTCASISEDGRYVAFSSEANNLLPPGEDTNLRSDVFVRDLSTDTTERVSIKFGGGNTTEDSYHPQISADGGSVAFISASSNILEFGDDTNAVTDTFVWNRSADSIERVSVNSSGEQIIGGSSDSYGQLISSDGDRVVFTSSSSDVVSGDTNGVSDVFVHDLSDGSTKRVSVSNGGEEVLDSSFGGSISPDGNYVSFNSRSNDLVSGYGDGFYNVFLHDLSASTTELVTVDKDDESQNDDSVSSESESTGSISSGGRYVAFKSVASDLVSNDTNDVFDVFVRDRSTVTGGGIPIPTTTTTTVTIPTPGHGIPTTPTETVLTDTTTDSTSSTAVSVATTTVPTTTTTTQPTVSTATVAAGLKVKSAKLKKRRLTVKGSCAKVAFAGKLKVTYKPKRGKSVKKSVSCKSGKWSVKLKVGSRKGGKVTVSYAGDTNVLAGSASKRVKGR